MSLQVTGDNPRAMRVAKKVINEVEREMSRVASMGGSKYDTAPVADRIEFTNLDRTAVRRWADRLVFGSANFGGWTARGQFSEACSDQLVSMDSTVKKSTTKRQKASYCETEVEKIYTLFNKEVKSGDGVVNRHEHTITVSVNKATGALFMEDSTKLKQSPSQDGPPKRFAREFLACALPLAGLAAALSTVDLETIAAVTMGVSAGVVLPALAVVWIGAMME